MRIFVQSTDGRWYQQQRQGYEDFFGNYKEEIESNGNTFKTESWYTIWRDQHIVPIDNINAPYGWVSNGGQFFEATDDAVNSAYLLCSKLFYYRGTIQSPKEAYSILAYLQNAIYLSIDEPVPDLSTATSSQRATIEQWCAIHNKEIIE